MRFVDIGAQTMELRTELDSAIAEVVNSSAFILGPQVTRFETAFAEYCGAAYCVAVDSGFSALEMILRGLRLQPGDEVITQANTFIATVSAIQQAGAKVVLIDCRDDGSADPDAAAAAIGPRTRALMPVWLYGRLSDSIAWRDLAQTSGAQLVEDACQAHGAAQSGLRAGAIGRAAAFSFYPGKNLGAFGDAGAVTTDDPNLAEWLRQARDYGQRRKYEHVGVPLNRRMDTMQAAVLGVKLTRLDAWNHRRRQVADAYRQALADLPLSLPTCDSPEAHVYHLFPVEVDDRARLIQEFEHSEIPTGIHYPQAMNEVGALSLGYSASAFPVARRRAGRMVSLPIHPHLGMDDVAKVTGAIRRHLGG